MSKRKNKKRRIDAMSAALFLFAASVMMFVGVTGVMHIGTSYAVGDVITNAPKEVNVLDVPLEGYKLITWSYDEQDTSLWYLTNFQGKNVNTSDSKTYHLYCLEKNLDMPTSGKYTQDAALTAKYVDEGITFLVTNAYPYNNNFMVGEDEKTKKAVTQWAIWYYLDQKGIASDAAKLSIGEKQAIQSNNPYAKIIRDLVSQALAQQASPASSLSIEESGNYSITADGKYLETGYFRPIANNEMPTYQIKFSGNSYGAFVVTDNYSPSGGNGEGTSFPGTSSFKIRIPMDNIRNLDEIDLSFNVVGEFVKRKVYAYRGENDSIQTALIPEFDSVTEEVSKVVTLKAPTGKVKISKQDITTSKELAGATMVINDCRGNVVAKWVSTDKPYEIDALPVNDTACKYQLFESQAPNGYELSKEVIEFDVKNDGSVTELVYKNNPLTPTPDTGLNIPFTVYIAGGIILICGIAIIYASVKPKKEN